MPLYTFLPLINRHYHTHLFCILFLLQFPDLLHIKYYKIHRWPVTLQVTKQIQENSFISYVLSDQVWWCNIKQFLSYSKNYTGKFMRANSWHHKLFHFSLPFWIWKFMKKAKKLQKFEYLENEKSFLNEIKNISHSFSRAIIWWKHKNLIKNSRHKI